MQEVDINGTACQVRGLTRAQIIELAAAGYPITRWALDFTGLGIDLSIDAMFDSILKMGLNGAPLDMQALTPAQESALFKAIIKETYGDPDAEKNLLKSGNTSQTENV